MKTNRKWPKTQCFAVPAERPQIANAFSRSCESRSTHFSSFPVLCKTTTRTNLGNFKVSTTTWAHKNEALFIITSMPFEPIPCRILVPQCDWDEIIAKYSGRQRRVAHVLWTTCLDTRQPGTVFKKLHTRQSEILTNFLEIARLIRRFRKKPEVAWKRGLRALILKMAT